MKYQLARLALVAVLAFCQAAVFQAAVAADRLAIAVEGSSTPLELTSLEALAVLRPGDVLSLSSASGLTATVQLQRVGKSPSGNVSLSGKTPDGGSLVLVTTPSGWLEGLLKLGFYEYRIQYKSGFPVLRAHNTSVLPRKIDGGGLAPQSLVPLDKSSNDSTMPLTRNLEWADAHRGAPRSSNLSPAFPVYRAQPVIDVLVYYDSQIPQALAVIDTVIEFSNLVYSADGMGFELRLAQALPLSIPGDQSNLDLLNAMRANAAPFGNLLADRATHNADLVHTIRANKTAGESRCGIASFSVFDGEASRDNATGVTEWQPPSGSGHFCSSRTFTHELGHNMGAAHQREDYVQADHLIIGAGYFYSFGRALDGSFQTIMGTGSNPELDLFSSPQVACEGLPCGISPAEAGAADNRRTLMNASYFIAAYGGGFDAAGIQEYALVSTCSRDTSIGFRGHIFRNNTALDVDVRRLVYRRGDGSIYDEREYAPGSFTVASGQNLGFGFCDDTDNQPFGDDIRESYYVYENPETGALLEGSRVLWDDNYAGAYANVRAVAGEGGAVVGAPSVIARTDAEVELTFSALSGFKLAEVVGTCAGDLHNGVFTVSPVYGDCWAEARFEPLDAGDRLLGRVNELLQAVLGVRSGSVATK